MRLFVLFLCLIVTVSDFKRVENFSGPKDKRVPSQCLTDNKLAQEVVALSHEYDEAQAAQNVLRRSASNSSVCKQRIIAAVMSAMDKPGLDISRDQASANLWREGAILLGDLKAMESLDLLLSHIKMTDGEWSTTMTHQPALEGIVRMGPAAIPKLKELLRKEDAQTRFYTVYCLASIGGISARRTLQKERFRESDHCVKRFIDVSIKTIDVKHGGLKQDRGEWANAFLCQPSIERSASSRAQR